MSCDNHAVQVQQTMALRGMTTKLLQRSQLCHWGEFSTNARWQSCQCSQNLRGHFMRAILPTKVEGGV